MVRSMDRRGGKENRKEGKRIGRRIGRSRQREALSHASNKSRWYRFALSGQRREGEEWKPYVPC